MNTLKSVMGGLKRDLLIVSVHPRMSILGEFKAAARFEPQA